MRKTKEVEGYMVWSIRSKHAHAQELRNRGGKENAK